MMIKGFQKLSLIEYPGKLSAVVFLGKCDFRCHYCVAKGSLVLNSDFKAIPIEEVNIGDYILSVQIPKKKEKHVKPHFTRIVDKMFRMAEVYEVVTENGSLKITEEHPLLNRDKRWLAIKPKKAPVKAYRLKVGDKIKFFTKPETFVEDNDYMKGYIYGALRGDGLVKFYPNYANRYGRSGPKFVPFFRFAVKDDEFLLRVQNYLAKFGISLKIKDTYCKGINKGLVSRKKEVFNAIKDLLHKGKSDSWFRGFLAGFFDAEGTLSHVLRIHNTDSELLELAHKGFENLSIPVTFENRKDKHHEKLYSLRILGGTRNIAKFFMKCNPAITRKKMKLLKPTLKGCTQVLKIKVLGKMPVYNLTTENGMFIVDGFITHNCYNIDLVKNYKKLPNIPEKEILDFLSTRRGLLDAVAITGGEPTIHKGLPAFMKKIKELGFLIMLETNGSNPGMVNELINKKLVDYIAMDIKASLEKYDEVAGVKVDKKKIQESIDIIRNSRVDHEFRTTVIPKHFKKEDALAIGKWLKSSKRYVLQQFRPDKTLDESYQKMKPYPPEKLKEFAKILKLFFKSVKIRGI